MSETDTVKVVCAPSHVAEADPIVVDSHHMHHFYGNTSTSQASTFSSMMAHKPTTAAIEYPTGVFPDTAAYWHPRLYGAGRALRPRRLNVYYRDGSERGDSENIPVGAKMLGNRRVIFKMRGRTRIYTTTRPLIGTRDEWEVRVAFPDLWNGDGLEPSDFAYSRRSGGSDDNFRTHPLKLVETRFALHMAPVSTGLRGPITVSSGHGETLPVETGFHGDIWYTVQPSFLDLFDRCGITQPLAGAMPDFCRTVLSDI